MEKKISNPLLNAVNQAIGLPTVEDLFCQGKLVNYMELKEFLGDRLVISEQRLCMSHARSLAAHTNKYKEVMVPILIAKTGDRYHIVNGFHRIAAIDMLMSKEPNVKISVKAILQINEYGKDNKENDAQVLEQS